MRQDNRPGIVMIIRNKARANTGKKTILLVIISLFWFAQYVYIPYQVTYLLSIGVPVASVGIIVGAYGFSQMILRMPAGVMADRKGRHKPFILLGSLLAGAASLLRILWPSGFSYFVANLLSGLGSAMWISFMILYFSYFPEDRKQTASSLSIAANNLGILAGFAASTILQKRFGIRFLCLLSVLAAAAALILSFSIRETEPACDPPPLRELLNVCADRRLIVFSLLTLIQQGILMSTAMSFTAQVAEERGATSTQIGICSTIYILTAVLSSYFAASKTVGKGGARFWIPAILACVVIYCFLIPNIGAVEWIYGAQILSGLSNGVLFSFCTSEAMKNVPKRSASTAMGFYQAVYAFGMTTFPILTGAVSGALDIRSAYYVLAAIALLGFAGAVLFYGITGARVLKRRE